MLMGNGALQKTLSMQMKRCKCSLTSRLSDIGEGLVPEEVAGYSSTQIQMLGGTMAPQD